MKDYYQFLGVNKDATADEIKSAYRKLSKKFHPDVNDGDKFFEERFKEIQEAYEVLSNPVRKSSYDAQHGFKSETQGRGQQSKPKTESDFNRSPPPPQQPNNVHQEPPTQPKAKKSNANVWGIVIFVLVGGFIHAVFKNLNKNQKTYTTPIETAYTPTNTTTESISPIEPVNKAKAIKTTSIAVLLRGTWVGTAYQYDISETWDVKLVSKKGKYTIKYPSLGCGGKWVLIESNSHKMVFREQISYGAETCNNGGTIVITLDNSEELKLSYYYPNLNTLNASGNLRKL